MWKSENRLGNNIWRTLLQHMSAANKQATELRDEYISTEHVLLAVIEGQATPAARMLREEGVTAEAVLKALQDIRGTQRVTDQTPEDKPRRRTTKVVPRHQNNQTPIVLRTTIHGGETSGRLKRLGGGTNSHQQNPIQMLLRSDVNASPLF